MTYSQPSGVRPQYALFEDKGFGFTFPTQKQDYSQMSDNLDKYLPEFDEDEIRNKLADLIAEQLKDMLVSSYKLRRVIAKMLDQEMNKLRRIEEIIAEPSSLTKMPGIPTADDLRRMTEGED
jgi:DNA gyrase/topoisomerase IV subunit A